MKFLNTNPKILDLDGLLLLAKKVKSMGKKVVLCDGHFNVIHPGHIRFLNFSKKQGDLLIVSIVNQKNIGVSNIDDYYSEDERAEGVASHEMVDAVHILNHSTIEFINRLKPDFYIKGREFENQQSIIKHEIDAVELNNGKVVFSSGEVDHGNFKPVHFKNSFAAINKRKLEFFKTCEKQDISLLKLKQTVDEFKKLKILVIGDTIVDQFVSCDTLGVSSEAPVLAIRELENKEFKRFGLSEKIYIFVI